MNKLTASVVLYNTPESQLSRLLSCIERAVIIETVYLIDNSPVPATCGLYKQPWVKYIRSKINVGYGAGHNIGLKQVLLNSEFHFVLNPDIYFEPQELQKMIDRMKDDESIGQLMPKVIYPDGSLQYLCKLIPTPVDLFFRRFLRGPFGELARKKAEQFELRFTGYNHEMDIPYLSGCFMLFRTKALRFLGRQNRTDMARHYAQCDTVLFPSKLETWGLPISEAKAHGKSLLVADLPYAHETVGTYSSVSFLPPNDAAVWAMAFEAILDGKWVHSGSIGIMPSLPFAADWRQLWSLLTEGL